MFANRFTKVRWAAALALATEALGLVFWMNPLERLIFYPDPLLVAIPADVGLEFEDVRFETADGERLHGWFVPGRRRETLVWFHGNAGNISHRVDNLRLLHDLIGTGILLFDYRGYGESSGTPSEQGLFADARGALRYLRARRDVDAKRIVYFGRSLGAAVAVDLAAEAPPHRLILESAFLSIRAMARAIFPVPLALLAPSSFDNLGKASRLGGPILIIHGDRDEIVPFEQGRELFEACPEPKSFFRVRGAGHNDTYLVGGAKYFERIAAFLDAPS
jgi:fermentation-respiration switch protein FrsA (DUF1100 family)